MSKVQEFIVAPGQTQATVRLTKAAQHVMIRRTSSLAILTLGLLAGLGETISAEITHPTRKRAVIADRVPLSHMASWSQYGRGPILERTQAESAQTRGFGTAAAMPPSPVYVSNSTTPAPPLVMVEVIVYLNDEGPIEVLADDQFVLTLDNLVPFSKYEIFVPEQPVIAANAQEFYSYEQSLILEGDREKSLYVKGMAGIIIPNDDVAIERIVITYLIDDAGQTKESEYDLAELLDTQGQANPFFNVMNFESPDVTALRTVFSPSSRADLLVIDFKHITNFEIHTTLGQRLEYTLVRVADRNNI